MTASTATQIIASFGQIGSFDAPRLGSLRALFARMAAAARADTARRSTVGMSEHMLRDLGLTRGDLDVIDL